MEATLKTRQEKKREKKEQKRLRRNNSNSNQQQSQPSVAAPVESKLKKQAQPKRTDAIDSIFAGERVGSQEEAHERDRYCRCAGCYCNDRPATAAAAAAAVNSTESRSVAVDRRRDASPASGGNEGSSSQGRTPQPPQQPQPTHRQRPARSSREARSSKHTADEEEVRSCSCYAFVIRVCFNDDCCRRAAIATVAKRHQTAAAGAQRAIAAFDPQQLASEAALSQFGSGTGMSCCVICTAFFFVLRLCATCCLLVISCKLMLVCCVVALWTEAPNVDKMRRVQVRCCCELQYVVFLLLLTNAVCVSVWLSVCLSRMRYCSQMSCNVAFRSAISMTANWTNQRQRRFASFCLFFRCSVS